VKVRSVAGAISEAQRLLEMWRNRDRCSSSAWGVAKGGNSLGRVRWASVLPGSHSGYFVRAEDSVLSSLGSFVSLSLSFAALLLCVSGLLLRPLGFFLSVSNNLARLGRDS